MLVTNPCQQGKSQPGTEWSSNINLRRLKVDPLSSGGDEVERTKSLVGVVVGAGFGVTDIVAEGVDTTGISPRGETPVPLRLALQELSNNAVIKLLPNWIIAFLFTISIMGRLYARSTLVSILNKVVPYCNGITHR